MNWDLTRINQNISGKWAKKSLYVKHFSSPQCSIQPRRHISTNVWRAARTVTRGRAHKILCYWRPPWSDYWDNIQRLELLSHSPSYSPSSLMSSRLPMVDAMKATTVAVAHWHPLATTGSTRRARKVCRRAQLSGEPRSAGGYFDSQRRLGGGTRRPAPGQMPTRNHGPRRGEIRVRARWYVNFFLFRGSIEHRRLQKKITLVRNCNMSLKIKYCSTMLSNIT